VGSEMCIRDRFNLSGKSFYFVEYWLKFKQMISWPPPDYGPSPTLWLSLIIRNNQAGPKIK